MRVTGGFLPQSIYQHGQVTSHWPILFLNLNQKEPKISIDFSEDRATERILINTKFYATFGRCYSIEMPDDIISNGIISIEFIAKVDIYVYFGHPGQFMHVDTKAKVEKYFI